MGGQPGREVLYLAGPQQTRITDPLGQPEWVVDAVAADTDADASRVATYGAAGRSVARAWLR